MAIYRIRASYSEGDRFGPTDANLFSSATRDFARTFAKDVEGPALAGLGSALHPEHRITGVHDDPTIAHAAAFCDWTGAALNTLEATGCTVTRVSAGLFYLDLTTDTAGETIQMAAVNRWGLIIEIQDADLLPIKGFVAAELVNTVSRKYFRIKRNTALGVWGAFDCDFAVWAYGEREFV